MNLQGVITCVNYSDFLAETLPHNKAQFQNQNDKLVVVTAPEDTATLQVCDYYDVEVVKTDAFQSRWGEFHKAKGINAGLEWLQSRGNPGGWVVHMDADVALPPRARVLLDRANLDRSSLYGVDRLRVENWEAWKNHLALPNIQTDGYHVRLGDFPLVARFNAWHINGYAPVGYFQLWHPTVSGITRYPAEHGSDGSADRTDVLFAQQWDRAHRGLIPEFAVYHLESEPHMQGTNWDGRQTIRFGPDPERSPLDYPHRRYPHHKHHHHRHHPCPGPYPEPPRPDPHPHPHPHPHGDS